MSSRGFARSERRAGLGTLALSVALGVALALAGCSGADRSAPARAPSSAAPDSPQSSSPPPPVSSPPAARPTGPPPSGGRPARALLSIPRLGIVDLAVVPYRGFTDDAPGTRIQNGGVAASPHGPRGGTGPGGIGNYQVTAHRLSSTRAFEFLPRLRRGDRVQVHADGVRYVYEIRTTRRTSFRSAQSLRAQRAAVPGRPGARPTAAMITLSTCATPEDHAVGNFWADEFDNPEHRIDKIGVLVAVRA